MVFGNSTLVQALIQYDLVYASVIGFRASHLEAPAIQSEGVHPQ